MQIRQLSIFLFVVAFLFAGCDDEAGDNAVLTGTLIDNVNVLSPDQDNFVIGYVIFDGEYIRQLGLGKFEGEFEGTRIDGSGKFLIPGLIDAKVRLTRIPGLELSMLDSNSELKTAYYQQMLRSYLYHGFTTVIDHGSDPFELDRIALDAKETPNFYYCSQQLDVLNGYSMRGENPDSMIPWHPNFLHDPESEFTADLDVDFREHAADVTVKRLVEDGAVGVSMVYNDGIAHSKVTWESPSQNVIRKVVEASHRETVPMIMETNSYGAQRYGFGAGVDVFSNGMWRWGPDEIFEDVYELSDTHQLLLYAIATTGTGYMPTLRVPMSLYEMLDEEFLADPNYKQVMPLEIMDLIDSMREANVNLAVEEYFPGITEKSLAFQRNYIGKFHLRNTVSAMVLESHNGLLLFGSDTPTKLSAAAAPGYNGYRELVAWSESGLQLSRILRSATLSNAKTFHLDGELGSITPGMRADMLLLTMNPLETVEAYNSIETVIVAGKAIDRESLKANP